MKSWGKRIKEIEIGIFFCLLFAMIFSLLSLQRFEEMEFQVQLKGLTEFLSCGLCKGYLIEATAITECLHTCKLPVDILIYNLD